MSSENEKIIIIIREKEGYGRHKMTSGRRLSGGFCVGGLLNDECKGKNRGN